MESSSSLRVESDLKVRKAKSKAQFTNARRALLVAAMSEQPESGIIKAYMDVLGEAAMQAVEAILSLAEVVETNAHLLTNWMYWTMNLRKLSLGRVTFSRSVRGGGAWPARHPAPQPPSNGWIQFGKSGGS